MNSDFFVTHVQIDYNFLRVQTSIIDLNGEFLGAERELDSENTEIINLERFDRYTHFSPIPNNLNTLHRTNRGRRRRGKGEDIGAEIEDNGMSRRKGETEECVNRIWDWRSACVSLRDHN